MIRWIGLIGFSLFSLQAFALSDPIRGTANIQEGDQIKPYANQIVRVQIFEKNKNIATAQIQTDADGKYTMPTDDLQLNWYYRVAIPYQETDFYSSFFRDVREPVPAITVAQTTGSLEELEASHIVLLEFSKNSDLIKVTHQVDITNNGNLAYHPNHPDAKPLTWQLFDGGFNLSLIENIDRDDLSIDEEKNLMIFQRMFLPGQKEAMRFSYLLPLDEKTITYVHESSIISTQNHWVSNQSGTKIIFSGVETKEPPKDLQKTFKKTFILGSLSADTPHTIIIKGYLRNKDRPLLWTFAASALLFLLFIMVLFWKKQRSSAQVWTKESLITEIKRLQQDVTDHPNQNDSIAKDIHRLKVLLYGKFNA